MRRFDQCHDNSFYGVALFSHVAFGCYRAYERQWIGLWQIGHAGQYAVLQPARNEVYISRRRWESSNHSAAESSRSLRGAADLQDLKRLPWASNLTPSVILAPPHPNRCQSG